MKKQYKFIIYTILICAIGVCASILYRINQNDKVDNQLYEEIYHEYDNISNSKEKYNDLNLSKEFIDTFYENKSNSSVIGKIKIEKLGIEYPILNKTTDEFLKIAPTLYYGAKPNFIGNMVLVAHNNYNNTMFSNIHKLNINDKINITDTYNKTLTYKVYEKEIILETDFSCTSQDTNDKTIITLITCTSDSKKRLMIKAVES